MSCLHLFVSGYLSYYDWSMFHFKLYFGCKLTTFYGSFFCLVLYFITFPVFFIVLCVIDSNACLVPLAVRCSVLLWYLFMHGNIIWFEGWSVGLGVICCSFLGKRSSFQTQNKFYSRCQYLVWTPKWVFIAHVHRRVWNIFKPRKSYSYAGFLTHERKSTVTTEGAFSRVFISALSNQIWLYFVLLIIVMAIVSC